MKKNILCTALAFAALQWASAATYPWDSSFRNVTISSAAGSVTYQVNAFDWSKGIAQADGILYLPVQLTTAGGWSHTMRVNLARIDLRAANIRFTGTQRSPDWGGDMIVSDQYKKDTVLEKTTDFLARNRGSKAKTGGRGRDMRLAMNATSWWPFSGGSNDLWGELKGAYYADGIQISHNFTSGGGHCGDGMFVVYKDGTVAIVDTFTDADVKNIWLAVHKWESRILRKGVPVKNDWESRPRTAVGLSEDGRYVYFCVADGDYSSWSSGANYEDMGNILLRAGAYEAIAFDGGGSACMAGWDSANGRPMMLGKVQGGTTVGSERSDGSNIGVYLAPTVAKIGTFVYDDFATLLQDIADRETPDDCAEIDVLADVVFPSAQPYVPAGTNFLIRSSANKTIAWEDGAPKVAAGSRVTFDDVAFAAGNDLLQVAAGGTAEIRGGRGLTKVVTADRQGFVLGGALAGKLTVDCAAATVLGQSFGMSRLSFAETEAQLAKIVSAADAGFIAEVVSTANGLELRWGRLALGPCTVSVAPNQLKARISFAVLAAAPSLGKGNRLRLVLTNDDGTSQKTYEQAFSGVGDYAFDVAGAGLGYSYAIRLIDGAGKQVANTMTGEGVLLFGDEEDWFSADVETGTAVGGVLTVLSDASCEFSASEGSGKGRVRVIVTAGLDELPSIETTLACLDGNEKLTGALGVIGVARNAESSGGDWCRIVRSEGQLSVEPLYGYRKPAESSVVRLMVEADCSLDSVRMRYFAGSVENGAVELLHDASGRTVFDPLVPPMSAGCKGVVNILGHARTLEGFRLRRSTKANVYYLTRR